MVIFYLFEHTYISKEANSFLKQTSLGVNFINILRAAFRRASPKSKKIYSQVVSLFWAFGIYAHKSCSKNVDEIDTWYLKIADQVTIGVAFVTLSEWIF